MVFGDVHFNCNNMVSKVANYHYSPMWTKVEESQESKKITGICKKGMFSKAVNT